MEHSGGSLIHGADSAQSQLTSSSANAVGSRQTNERRRHPDLNQRLAVRRRGFGTPLLPGRAVSPILDACAPRAHQGSPERTSSGERSPPSPLDLLKDFGNSTTRRRTERRPSLVRILEDSTATPIQDEVRCDEKVDDARCGSPTPMPNSVMSPRSPIDVLKDFSASTRRRQNLGRTSVANIYEVKTPIKEDRRNPSTSWYENASNNPSPTPNYSDEDTMHCAEAFLLPRTPTPLTSPLTMINRRRSNRSKSQEASLYIDHLECQLASAQTQLEVYTSPATTSIASAELRKLEKESESLRKEVGDWERQFEERVAEELRLRAGVETRSNARITNLEHEVACKQERAVELELELERAQRRVSELERSSRFMVARTKQMEALDAANRDLQSRVDMLTGLLAHSQSVPSTPTSPERTVARNLPPRPWSMGEFGTGELCTFRESASHVNAIFRQNAA